MGNKSSKKTTKSPDTQNTVGVCTSITKSGTETQLDSMMISALILPVHGKQLGVTLGLVNSVAEEIERLIEDYSLNLRPEECELVIVGENGERQVMLLDDNIEVYMDELCISSNIVQLVHNPSSDSPASPNLGSLGVNIKSS